MALFHHLQLHLKMMVTAVGAIATLIAAVLVGQTKEVNIPKRTTLTLLAKLMHIVVSENSSRNINSNLSNADYPKSIDVLPYATAEIKGQKYDYAAPTSGSRCTEECLQYGHSDICWMPSPTHGKILNAFFIMLNSGYVSCQ